MIRNLLYILCIILAAGCEEDNQYFMPGESPEILFQVEYINHAWGFQHSGFMIDSSGSVRKFNLPADWHYPDSLGYISITDMKENISRLSGTGPSIGADIVRSYYNMLGEVTKGKYSDPANTMFDFGEIVYSGFLPDSGKDRYKQVVIWQDGDLTITNSAPEAEKLHSWLKGILNSPKE